MGDRVLAGVDAVGVGDHPAVLGLAEHLGQPHPGQALGGEQVAQDLPGADAGELVDVADQQQVRPGGIALTSLLANSTSSIEVSSTTTRSASRGWSRSKAASPPGRSCSSRCRVAASSPASSDRRLAARPVGAASRILARFGAGQGDDGAHGVALAAARPAGQHRHPLGQGQPHRRGLLGGQRDAHGAAQPVQRDRPVHRLRPGQPIAGRAAAGAAARRPARPRHDGTAPARSLARPPPGRPATPGRGAARQPRPPQPPAPQDSARQARASTPSSPVALATSSASGR